MRFQAILEAGLEAHRLEGNHHHGLEVNRSAVLGGGAKVPVGKGGAGELVELVVHPAQDAYITHRAIVADDRVERDRALYVAAHQFQRIGGVHFSRCLRRRQVALGLIRIELGEANDPASARGIQIGHVQGHGVKLFVAKNPAIDVGRFVPGNFRQ